MECRGINPHVAEFSARDGDSRGIALLIETRADGQTGRRGGSTNQLDDHLMAHQRLTSPILGDVTEHAMLNLVPLAGAGREVAHGDAQPGLRGESVEAGFPETRAVAVTAPSVSQDQQTRGPWVGAAAHT